jgi:hypothetical protein
MEFARRLRLLWAVVCLLAAAACVAAYFYSPYVPTFFIGLAALILGLTPYFNVSTTAKLSIMWLGAGSSLALAVSWFSDFSFAAQCFVFVFIFYFAVVCILWLTAPLWKRRTE